MIANIVHFGKLNLGAKPPLARAMGGLGQGQETANLPPPAACGHDH